MTKKQVVAIEKQCEFLECLLFKGSSSLLHGLPHVLQCRSPLGLLWEDFQPEPLTEVGSDVWMTRSAWHSSCGRPQGQSRDCVWVNMFYQILGAFKGSRVVCSLEPEGTEELILQIVIRIYKAFKMCPAFGFQKTAHMCGKKVVQSLKKLFVRGRPRHFG